MGILPILASRKRLRLELISMAVGVVVVYLVAGKLDLFERFVDFAHHHESWEFDETVPVALFLLLFFLYLAQRLAVSFFLAERQTREAHARFVAEQEKLKQLQGILPICSSCKKIRDEAGAWQSLETYIDEHSEATFSHGICQECVKKLYPDGF